MVSRTCNVYYAEMPKNTNYKYLKLLVGTFLFAFNHLFFINTLKHNKQSFRFVSPHFCRVGVVLLEDARHMARLGPSKLRPSMSTLQ